MSQSDPGNLQHIPLTMPGPAHLSFPINLRSNRFLLWHVKAWRILTIKLCIAPSTIYAFRESQLFQTSCQSKISSQPALSAPRQTDVALHGAIHPLPGKQGTLQMGMKCSSLNQGSSETVVQHRMDKALPSLSLLIPPAPKSRDKEQRPILRSWFLLNLPLSHCNSNYQIYRCKELMWTQGNSTNRAMHQYLALTCGRGPEAVQKFASVLVTSLQETNQSNQCRTSRRFPFLSL